MKQTYLVAVLCNRGVATGGCGEGFIPPEIWEFSEPYSNQGGADYAHHITVAPPRFLEGASEKRLRLFFSFLSNNEDCNDVNSNAHRSTFIREGTPLIETKILLWIIMP